eukprot:1434291-Amphidinium_carterae.1
MMRAIGLSMILIIMCFGFTLVWHTRKSWTENETMTNGYFRVSSDRDNEGDKKSEVRGVPVSITTVPEVQRQPTQLRVVRSAMMSEKSQQWGALQGDPMPRQH